MIPSLVVFVLLLAVPRGATAQPLKSLEVSGGYAFVHDPTDDVSFPIGWNASAAGRITGWCAAVAEVSASRKTIQTVAGDLRISVHAYMAGARGSITIGRFREFGQFLVGAARVNGTAFGFVSSRRHLAIQAGGGADFAFTPAWAVRAQVDYRAIPPSESGGGTGHRFRALSAIVYTVF